MKIIHVTLKLYSEGIDEENIHKELNKLFEKSDKFLISSFKSHEISEFPNEDHSFEELKKSVK